jgi:hypothetical protein
MDDVNVDARDNTEMENEMDIEVVRQPTCRPCKRLVRVRRPRSDVFGYIKSFFWMMNKYLPT